MVSTATRAVARLGRRSAKAAGFRDWVTRAEKVRREEAGGGRETEIQHAPKTAEFRHSSNSARTGSGFLSRSAVPCHSDRDDQSFAAKSDYRLRVRGRRAITLPDPALPARRRNMPWGRDPIARRGTQRRGLRPASCGGRIGRQAQRRHRAKTHGTLG